MYNMIYILGLCLLLLAAFVGFTASGLYMMEKNLEYLEDKLDEREIRKEIKSIVIDRNQRRWFLLL